MQLHKKEGDWFLTEADSGATINNVKSVEREKYRPKRTAQRAWQMLQAGTMPGQGRTPASCKRNPRYGAVWAPQAARYSGSVSKVNVYGKGPYAYFSMR